MSLITVDNTDGQVTYHGQWTSSTGSILAHAGSVFNNTLTGPQSQDSSIEYAFSGTRALVYVATDLNDSTSTPIVRCFMDGSAFPAASSLADTSTNVLACDQRVLDGPHVVSMNITLPSFSSLVPSIYFDYLQYAPSDDAELPEGNDGMVSTAVTSSDITFSPGWKTFGDSKGTSIVGATLTYKFNGTSVAMYGNATTSARGTYVIDNEPPKMFSTQSNSVYFSEDGLSADSEHTLVVKNAGNSTELMVDSFMVQTGSESGSSSTTTSTSATSILSHLTSSYSYSPTSTLTSSFADVDTVSPITTATASSSAAPSLGATPAYNYNMGGVVGGVLGGVAFVISALIFYINVIRRRRLQRKAAAIEESKEVPIVYGDDGMRVSERDVTNTSRHMPGRSYMMDTDEVVDHQSYSPERMVQANHGVWMMESEADGDGPSIVAPRPIYR